VPGSVQENDLLVRGVEQREPLVDEFGSTACFVSALSNASVAIGSISVYDLPVPRWSQVTRAQAAANVVPAVIGLIAVQRRDVV